MRRFFRHPLHRTAAAVLTCAALLGYFLPALITAPSVVSALAVAISLLIIVGYTWSVLRDRMLRRGPKT